MNDETYKVVFTSDKTNPINVSYKGVHLKGITGFQIETTNGVPKATFTVNLEKVECYLGFNCPQQSQFLCK